jgi:glycosyltransferase involved in cell wall biosynthesis
MELPRVSVLMLTYQHARYVRESVDSVLAQNYPTLQIVIGDDASTDGTQDILRDYAARYPGLFKLLLAETNQGITKNANQTFRGCEGEFIAFTSGDDVWLPGKLDKQVAWYREHPEAVICYTNAEHVDESGTTVLRLHHEKRRNPYRAGGIDVLLQSTVFFSSSSILVRRCACPPYGYDERVTWNSDWLLFAEIALHGSIGYVPEVLVRYRVHSGGAMQKLDRVLSDALLAFGILESNHPELMLQTRRLRQEFLTGSALQSLKQGDYDRASRYLRTAIRMNPRGDTYLSAPMKAALYVLSATGLLQRVYGLYEAFRKRRTYRLKTSP